MTLKWGSENRVPARSGAAGVRIERSPGQRLKYALRRLPWQPDVNHAAGILNGSRVAVARGTIGVCTSVAD
jgi:hypothetical protein